MFHIYIHIIDDIYIPFLLMMVGIVNINELDMYMDLQGSLVVDILQRLDLLVEKPRMTL